MRRYGYSFDNVWDVLSYHGTPAPVKMPLRDITDERVIAALKERGPSMPFQLCAHMGETSARLGQKMGKMFNLEKLDRVPARSFRTFTYSVKP